MRCIMPIKFILAFLLLAAVPGQSQESDILRLTEYASPERRAAVELRLRRQAEIDRLARIKALVEDDILAYPGVFGLGIGRSDDKSVFIALMESDAVAPDLPAEIEGVPLNVHRAGLPHLLNGAPQCGSNSPCHANQLPAPVQPNGQCGGLEQPICQRMHSWFQGLRLKHGTLCVRDQFAL